MNIFARDAGKTREGCDQPRDGAEHAIAMRVAVREAGHFEIAEGGAAQAGNRQIEQIRA